MRNTTINVDNDVTIKNSSILTKNYDEYTPLDIKNRILKNLNKLPIDDKMREDIKKNIDIIPDNPSIEQFGELKKASMIIDIVRKVVYAKAEEAFKGGHIMIQDNGSLYDTLKKNGLVKDRISSHHKTNKAESDASMQAGEIFKEFLVGKTKDGKTWFQLEAHSMGGIKNFIGHLIDFIKYKLTGKNVGQYGLSEHVDSKPIQGTYNSQDHNLPSKAQHSPNHKIEATTEASKGNTLNLDIPSSSTATLQKSNPPKKEKDSGLKGMVQTTVGTVDHHVVKGHKASQTQTNLPSKQKEKGSGKEM